MADTNVLIDIRERDPTWHPWSKRALAIAQIADDVAISAIVFGELAAGGSNEADIASFVADLGISISPVSRRAAFQAGHAQRAYRAAGGGRDKLLADFLIGAHAFAEGATLLTRDPRRYRRYFPDLLLVTPETDHD
ncbi:type II toxin-antitoxin system VapC family toxin [Sphingomonas sp. NFR15]|uniref:type II toxin-antitoxin system VapC family toxin n=2 Tax=Sphingomonas TaxID=13687 RepID=UPI0015A40007|nr:type II toxin-antitoxin system VapC family toxin [Sphingomonas sp. NFR15]